LTKADREQRVCRRKLTEGDRQTALRWLRGLRVRVDEDGVMLAFSQLSELAARHRLSVYDAAYLELAHRRKLALGCKDGPLRSATKAAGVTIWK
jgi:predicted nucleic acid-binding protein